MLRDWARWRLRTAVTCAVGVAAVVVTAGCSPSATSSSTAASLSPSPVSSRSASSGPASAPAAADQAQDAPYGACVARVFGRMSEAQRVGQLFLAGVSGDVAGPQMTAALHKYHFGSMLLWQSSEGVAALAAATAHMQSLATINGGVRFFIAANQEGGNVQHLTGPGFATMPAAVTQGTWTTSALRSAAAGWGRELRTAGVNFDLAPVMDVVPPGTAASNAPIGALGRDFGSTPSGNGAHGAAFITGMASAGVSTAAKHFPGLGRVSGNTDFTSDVVDSVTGPSDPYLGSFRAAVAAGVPFVMVALATYTKIDASELAVFSPKVMKLLRSEIGFRGVIMSDDIGDAAAVQSMPAASRAIAFLSAGGDLITSQSLPPAETMAAAVLKKASASPSFRAVVDADAQRILAAKKARGLLSC
jgi:beta-N-acetylhexosaminidase